MGTGGPGNIVHIDNLYVKTFNVKDNVNIVLGEYVVIENDGGFAVARPLGQGDFSADGAHLDLSTFNIVQAGENANNLDTTDALLRKNQIECITKGSDWTTVMETGVLPDSTIGIKRDDAAAVTFFVIATTTTAAEILGSYKHKEFSTVAEISVTDDNGIISTGRHI